jgi:hypothetical protein
VVGQVDQEGMYGSTRVFNKLFAESFVLLLQAISEVMYPSLIEKTTSVDNFLCGCL